MALRLRGGKEIKKSSYYVWYLGAREAKGVDAMPSAIDYLLERERLQEPFKVTLQVSNKGLKIIQTVHPGGSTKSAVKHLVPGHAVLAAAQREDVVAATLLLPNPASNNPVHVHAYRCDSVETADLLGAQLRALASQSDSNARVSSLDNRTRSNLGSDGRSTRESESSEGSGELRHIPVQTTTIYESLAAELRAKLGRANSGENDTGPILLPPRDYDTVHRHRGNLAGIEYRRCLNQTIVGGNTALDRGGTRSAASSGIGSDSAATPPPYHGHHSLLPRTSRALKDSSSDDDWGATDDHGYLAERESANLTLPRIPRSPERIPGVSRGVSPGTHQKSRRSAELRQRSPSPQYQPRVNPSEITSPRERFQDAKEMFKAMEREAIARPVITRQREPEIHAIHRRSHEDRISRHFPVISTSAPNHELRIRRSHAEVTSRPENAVLHNKSKPRPRTHHYLTDNLHQEPEVSRPRPRSFYETPSIVRELRGPRNVIDPRSIMERDYRDPAGLRARDIREKLRNKPMAYQELSEHERYPGLDRDTARPAIEIVQTPSRYRHSYAETSRLDLAALHPY